jgi:hypothetical protein
MAELIDSDKKNKLVLLPLRYEQKDEFWFSSEVSFIHEEKPFIKGSASFHINDWLELIEGIKFFVTDKKGLSFSFEPIEPYLKLFIKSVNNQYIVEAHFCKGPIFEPSDYKELQIVTLEEDLVQFMNQIKIELKNIDTDLEFKKIAL